LSVGQSRPASVEAGSALLREAGIGLLNSVVVGIVVGFGLFLGLATLFLPYL